MIIKYLIWKRTSICFPNMSSSPPWISFIRCPNSRASDKSLLMFTSDVLGSFVHYTTLVIEFLEDVDAVRKKGIVRCN